LKYSFNVEILSLLPAWVYCIGHAQVINIFLEKTFTVILLRVLIIS